MVHKTKFYRSLREWRIPHPLTLYPDEVSMQEMKQQLSFPVYIRPDRSHEFVERFNRKGFVAYTILELHRYLRLVEKEGIDVMVQEIIPGPTTNGYTIRGYLDKRSEPLVLFANQKIRQPSTFSNNCVKVSIPISQVADFCDTVVKYLTSLRYRGLFGVEFKLESKKDK